MLYGIVFSFQSSALGQAAQFKIEDQKPQLGPGIQVTSVKLRVLNVPTESATGLSSAQKYKVTLYRDQTSFAITDCSSGVAPPLDGSGYVVQEGILYCDNGVMPNTTYRYSALAVSADGKTTVQAEDNVTLQSSSNSSNGNSASTSSYKPLFQTTTSLSTFINNLVNWISYRIGPALVAFAIIYAGFLYIGSGGDETKIKQAKDMIWDTILGFAFLLLIGAIMRGFFTS